MSVEKNNEITVKVNKDFDEVIKILINRVINKKI